MGIKTPNGPNDPFCGHLWLDGVIEPLDGLMVHDLDDNKMVILLLIVMMIMDTYGV